MVCAWQVSDRGGPGWRGQLHMVYRWEVPDWIRFRFLIWCCDVLNYGLQIWQRIDILYHTGRALQCSGFRHWHPSLLMELASDRSGHWEQVHMVCCWQVPNRIRSFSSNLLTRTLLYLFLNICFFCIKIQGGWKYFSFWSWSYIHLITLLHAYSLMACLLQHSAF